MFKKIISILTTVLILTSVMTIGAMADVGNVSVSFEVFDATPEFYKPIQTLESGQVRAVAKFSGTSIPESAAVLVGLYKGERLLAVDFTPNVAPSSNILGKTPRITVPDDDLTGYKVQAMVLDNMTNLTPLSKPVAITAAEKKILSFKVGDVYADVQHGLGEILIADFADGVAPEITVSEGATISPASGIAIASPNGTVYTVTAADGSKAYYKVRKAEQYTRFKADSNVSYTAGQQVPGFANWQAVTLGTGQSISGLVDEATGIRYRNITDASTSVSTKYEWYCPAGSGRPDSWDFDLKFRFNKPADDYSANSVYFYLRNSGGKLWTCYGTSNDNKYPDIYGFSMSTSHTYTTLPSSIIVQPDKIEGYKNLAYGNWYTMRIGHEKVSDTKGVMSFYITDDNGQYIHSNRFDYVIDPTNAAGKIGYFGLETRALGNCSLDIQFVNLYRK